MDCGANEYTCQFIEWVLSNSNHLYELPKILGLVEGGWLVALIQQHGEKIVAIASFAFAVYKWWVYRERILHKRLEEYITESDKRLRPASSQVMEAILRPGRTATLPQPAFAVELREVLFRTSWAVGFGFMSPEAESKWRLGIALGGIRKRIRTSREALRSLQDQQAHVHLIAGAIAAARGRQTTNKVTARKYDQRALREFQKALLVPGHQRNATAKENEAFQLLRLGRAELALEAYEALEEFARNLPKQRDRDIVVARAKRYQAQIRQSQADGGALTAWILMARDQPDKPCALTLRLPYQTYTDWECIEQAEMHYVTAFIARRNTFTVQEPEQLREAESCYQDILSSRRWFIRKPERALWHTAKRGLARVEQAKSGAYDEGWLRVVSDQPNKPAATKSDGAGDQRIS
jgi:tetratricopeptide (TPR) repeat protein